jgi:cell migration-inducing and hyaluronan-binding protein
MAGGLVTIHLWGAPGDPGVTCKSPNCGIPTPPLGTNTRTMNPATCNPSDLPGSVNDCFYDYDALDPADTTNDNTTAYFGHKVLALSYGGTVQLFGQKGATYTATAATGCQENSSSCTGTSWARLNKNALPGDTELQVAGALDWQDQDNILLTTTDYLPGHSEQLTISGTPSVSNNVTTIKLATAVKYPHNGQTFDLSDKTYPGISRLGPNFPASAEMRAAVGLLSRSIRIISDGNTPGASFSVEPGNPDNYFGGHTIVRQGFMLYQVQGVEFYQLGQGGAIMHYPVHFHMARKVPLGVSADQPVTFVKDSSVWDSMTRWIVIHATQGVRIARNVGYESIGHGYYLEDGTETGNQLYANLGAFARGAVANGLTPDKVNPQNPRMVPGILTATAPVPPGCAKETPQNCVSGYSGLPFYSDSQNPSVFWIMNGMNDFQYNLASGAGTCGACYWFVPGAISGPSQTEKWFGYASEQQGIGRAGTTPLQNFVGNSCTSAMEGFVEVGAVGACNGVNQIDPAWLKSQNSTLVMLPSPQARPTSDTTYWPNTTGLRLPTRCPAADNPANLNPDCSSVPICASDNEANCDVIVLNGFTTAFNWAEGNFAAVWLRSLWSLAVNSVISDPQNAGLNMVTSGGYDAASVFPGYWGLVRQTAFIGSSQWQNSNNSTLAKNPYASDAGPFNPFKATIGTGDSSSISGLTCAADPFNGNSNNAYCLSQNDGVSFQVGNFFGFQRLFSVYDGPIFQDSNAFLNIHPTFLTDDGTAKGKILDTKGGKCEPSDTAGNPCQFAGFISAGVNGLRAYRPQKNGQPDPASNRCYEPNAAIGWKQPNGFYYAPAFHSVNLFFSDVDIRHFVTDPFFMGGPLSFKTNEGETKKEYCTWNPAYFQGFTDIDRETVLNDDDGTLTGLTSPVGLPIPTATPTPASRANDTISVNKADFFKAPTEAWECASDFPTRQSAYAPKCLPATAKTSPYQYVSTVIYPECAKKAPPPPMNGSPSFCPGDTNWGSVCTASPPNFGCPGVQLYRQLLTAGEKEDNIMQLKRMMGQNNFQRSALTVNHGKYYINTTVSKDSMTGANPPFASFNVFAGGGVYDLFFLYTQPDTQQTYQLFIGKDLPVAQTNVVFGYEGLTLPFNFTPASADDVKTGAWDSRYNPKDGILTLTTKLSRIASKYSLNAPVANAAVSLGQRYCQPSTMCSWNQAANRCQCNQNGPYASLCNQTNPAGQTVCDWSIEPLPLNCSNPNGCSPRFVDCPAPGCPAFQVTFPPACSQNQMSKCFVADDSQQRPMASPFNFANPNDPFNWDVNYNLESATLAGQQCFYTKQPDTTTTCPTVDLK